jgi:hypothetical protein
MKKLLLLISIAGLTVYGSYFYIHKKNKVLLRETFVKEINKNKFKSKINRTPANWITDQIKEEFSNFKNGITTKSVSETFNKIKSTYPTDQIIRYRIIDNQLYRYFSDQETIALKDNSLEKAIKTLLNFISIDNIDFILSHEDGILLSNQPKDFYITNNKDLQAPILCSAKTKDLPFVILIPDWRSISKWWHKESNLVIKANIKSSWEDKKDFAFWRGGSTNSIRLKLCQIALEYPNHLYSKINSKSENEDYQKKIEEDKIYCNKGWIPWEKILENKYLILLDGVMSAAPAFQSRLLSNCVTFKQDFPGVQWFFKPLKPYVHYIPLEKDISDVIEKIKWAKKNDKLCKEVSKNASDFALNNLMFEDVYLYFYLVLKEYSSLFTSNNEILKNETIKSSNWINIQNREKMKRKLKKLSIKNICNRASPDF